MKEKELFTVPVNYTITIDIPVMAHDAMEAMSLASDQAYDELRETLVGGYVSPSDFTHKVQPPKDC